MNDHVAEPFRAILNTVMKTENKRFDAQDIMTFCGIVVDRERLTDGSFVFNVLLGGGDVSIPCLSEKHAHDCAYQIAVAIHNASNL